MISRAAPVVREIGITRNSPNIVTRLAVKSVPSYASSTPKLPRALRLDQHEPHRFEVRQRAELNVQPCAAAQPGLDGLFVLSVHAFHQVPGDLHGRLGERAEIVFQGGGGVGLVRHVNLQKG